MWSYWYCYSSFAALFIKQFSIEKSLKKKLIKTLQACKEIHGLSMYDNICFVCERPTRLLIDDLGRLHNETGPALEYSDGYALYSWHGTRVNKEIILDPIVVSQIDSEQNAEVKRVMIERIGWDTYLRETNAELIDQYIDQLGNPVKLWKKDLGENFENPLMMIELTNSTPENGKFKSYMFHVPVEMITAKQAHAWHCGFDCDEIEFVVQS